MTDQDLIKKCLDFDRKAQKMIFDRYASTLLATVQRYVYDSFYSEDVFLKAFEKIFNHMERYEADKGEFVHWAKKIMINESLNHLRANKKYIFDDLSEALVSVEANSDHLSAIHYQQLQSLVKSLKAPYGTIFNMVEDGFKYTEIANLLNINEATCRSYYQRSKGMLQALILNQEKLPI
jgi:RNA polymerase sigma factor (sigma-70 family)